jgi:hypothetical protein
MARKSFRQKRKTPAPYRRGKQVAYYVPDDLREAIEDVARARGISRSELVCSILAAHPEIAAQMAFYADLAQKGTDAAPDGASIESVTDQTDQEDTDQERGQMGSGPKAPRIIRRRAAHGPDQTDQGEEADRAPLALVAVG